MLYLCNAFQKRRSQSPASRWQPIRKEVNDDEEGDFEVDAADHSVSDHGRTHGTGCHLVHGNVDEQALGEISGGFCYTMKTLP